MGSSLVFEFYKLWYRNLIDFWLKTLLRHCFVLYLTFLLLFFFPYFTKNIIFMKG